MHAGGEHGKRKGMKEAEGVRERRFILKGTFSSGISRVKNERGKSQERVVVINSVKSRYRGSLRGEREMEDRAGER